MAAHVYELTSTGKLPVALQEAKSYLKVPSSTTADDDLISRLLEASTRDVEKYLGRRSIRANTWTRYLDDFCSRIELRRVPVASITSVDRKVSGVWTAVSTAVYYLKTGSRFYEVLPAPDQDWPTDQDDGEQVVRVVFVTGVDPAVDMAKTAILRHVAFMFENRGDADPANSELSFTASGARGLLQRERIQKV